jgi:gamma-glutamyltranspeptidase / glutathione hydrolase
MLRAHVPGLEAMRGVIAAGSAATAEAGVRILSKGGNAVDAVIAACFATTAGEPTLTSLAGGGMMIFRTRAGDVAVCDFFADAPRRAMSDVPELDFQAVDLDFGPTTQRFHIGAGAAAVPGVIPGLCQALERFGSMSLADVVAPACDLLRRGDALGHYQARAARLLEPILTHTPAMRRVFQRDGAMLEAGDRFALPELADTLEAMARAGWRRHHDDVLVPKMLAQFGPDAGGLLGADDFTGYEVRFREPLALGYRGGTVLTVPPPAAGGTMIATMLCLLDGVDRALLADDGIDRVRVLAAAMQVADEARPDGRAALEPDRFQRWRARFEAVRRAPGLAAAPAAGSGSTTHVSVIDAEGNAAAVTFSYGEGNGHVIDGTGIVMNNLMGEEDLFPGGFGSAPRGERLTTMMSPTLLLHADGGITVLGTGGANRIRTAIVQTISLLCDRGCDPEHAVAAPRIHYEGGVLNAEVFDRSDGGAGLEAVGAPRLVRFPEPSLFFGGVHIVERTAAGVLRGAGDPRRGGVCRFV